MADFVGKKRHPPADFYQKTVAKARPSTPAIGTRRGHRWSASFSTKRAGANDGSALEFRFARSLSSRACSRNLVPLTTAMAHYALPMLKGLAAGSIVNISSKVALTGQGGTSAYRRRQRRPACLDSRNGLPSFAPLRRARQCGPAGLKVMTPLYQRWISTRENPQQALDEIRRPHSPRGIASNRSL